MTDAITISAPTAGPGSRPCSQCGQYVVGPENLWLCYRCGFDGPLLEDQAEQKELKS